MDQRQPKVFFYSESDREFKLSVGGCSTFEGLSLLAVEDATVVNVTAAWFDSGHDQPELQRKIRSAKTVSELSDALDDCWSLYDFSCIIGGEIDRIKLSSHDDGECHFTLPSQDACRRVLLNACPDPLGNKLWEAAISAPESYVCLCEESSKVKIFASFDDYLASLE